MPLECKFSEQCKPENIGIGRRHYSLTQMYLIVLPDTYKIIFVWNGSVYSVQLLCFMITTRLSKLSNTIPEFSGFHCIRGGGINCQGKYSSV